MSDISVGTIWSVVWLLLWFKRQLAPALPELSKLSTVTWVLGWSGTEEKAIMEHGNVQKIVIVYGTGATCLAQTVICVRNFVLS